MIVWMQKPPLLVAEGSGGLISFYFGTHTTQRHNLTRCIIQTLTHSLVSLETGMLYAIEGLDLIRDNI